MAFPSDSTLLRSMVRFQTQPIILIDDNNTQSLLLLLVARLVIRLQHCIPCVHMRTELNSTYEYVCRYTPNASKNLNRKYRMGF